MLTSDKNSLELLSLMQMHGVKDLVLCPGSRNAGIVHSALQLPQFCCHSIVDERCAGFFALGLAISTGLPVAVIVTSGSALANLYPAACEAFYQQVPLIFISADRPAEWIGQMDGQTMPQDGALGKMVKMSISLPMGNLWHTNRLVNEAFLECCHHTKGPVHINIPICEPIYNFTVEHLPKVRYIMRQSGMAPLPEDSRVLVLVGQMDACKGVILDREICMDGVSVVAENLSNMNPANYVNSYCVDWEKCEGFDIIITMGGHLTCKPMKEWIRRNRPQQHWHVSPDGRIADVFCCQTMAVECDEAEVMRNLCGCKHVELPRKEIRPSVVIDGLFELIPQGSAVHLANSSTVRLAQLSMPKAGITFLCNRGINGIEGSLSTAVGYALAMEAKNQNQYVIIGDLSFFYDHNALWVTHMPCNLHILLVNNQGGAIFDTLPIPDEARSREYIKGSHRMDARCVASQYGLKYLSGMNMMQEFVNSPEAVILEVNDF